MQLKQKRVELHPLQGFRRAKEGSMFGVCKVGGADMGRVDSHTADITPGWCLNIQVSDICRFGDHTLPPSHEARTRGLLQGLQELSHWAWREGAVQTSGGP